jgi:DNA-binding beta-propeller fold protein YncE
MKAITQSQLLSPLLASLALAAATSGMPAQAASCSIGNSPEGIVIDASGFLWVANTDLNTLSFFSPHQSGQSLLFGGLGDSPLNATNGLNGPTRIAVSGNEVYVTNAAGDTVTIWNDSANKQQTVPGVKRPLGIAVDGGGNYVVADNQTSDIAAFTSANLLLGVQTQDGNGHPFDAPGALAISGSILYVGTNDGTVHSYNESNFIEFYELARLGIRIPGLMTELTTFQDSASGGPTGIAVDAQGNVYVSY